MSPAIFSGIVTGDAPFSYWPIFFRFPSNTVTREKSLTKTQSQKSLQKSTRSSFVSPF